MNKEPGTFARCTTGRWEEVTSTAAHGTTAAEPTNSVQAPATEEVFETGNGVSRPSPITEANPEYTQDAKGARIEGLVRLKAVVNPDGHPDRIVVVKSLDKRYGLDDAAVAAAEQWRFKPCTKEQKPVACSIEMEMEFRLRPRP